MKTITITYNVFEMENGEKVTGETCMNITIMEDVADRLIKTGKSGVAIAEIEKAIAPLERLKGRTYIKGSIKDIERHKGSREAKASRIQRGGGKVKINAVVEIDENAIVMQMQKVKEAGDKLADEILRLRGMINVELPEFERERRNAERSLLINESVNEWCRNYQEQMKGHPQEQHDISAE